MIMGLGSALYEGVAFADGQVTNANLSDYEIPSIADMPEAFTHELVEHAGRRGTRARRDGRTAGSGRDRQRARLARDPRHGAADHGRGRARRRGSPRRRSSRRDRGIPAPEVSLPLPADPAARPQSPTLGGGPTNPPPQDGARNRRDNHVRVEGRAHVDLFGGVEGVSARKAGAVRVRFTLNGAEVEADALPTESLLTVLRRDFGILSVRETCGIGVCGACTALVDGRPDLGLPPVRAARRRRVGRHGRGARRRSPGAARVRGRARLPVRLLHAGHDADDDRAPRGEPPPGRRRDQARAGRQPLPVRLLRQDPRCGEARGGFLSDMAILVDLDHLGRPHVIGAWLLDGSEPALVDCGPGGCVDALLAGLARARPSTSRTCATSCSPTSTPTTAAPPARSSADTRTCRSTSTSAALRTWSTRVASSKAPARSTATTSTACSDRSSRFRQQTSMCSAASVLDLDVFPTPGHAWHHVSFLGSDGACYTGDAAGVLIPPGGFLYPAAAPPEIDLDAWERSLAAIEERRPTVCGSRTSVRSPSRRVTWRACARRSGGWRIESAAARRGGVRGARPRPSWRPEAGDPAYVGDCIPASTSPTRAQEGRREAALARCDRRTFKPERST